MSSELRDNLKGLLTLQTKPWKFTATDSSDFGVVQLKQQVPFIGKSSVKAVFSIVIGDCEYSDFLLPFIEDQKYGYFLMAV